MKRILIFTACLSITVALDAQDSKDRAPAEKKGTADKNLLSKYVVMIPPWVNMKQYSHVKAKNEILDMLLKRKEFDKASMLFQDSLETDEPEGGGNSFVATLPAFLANYLRDNFRISIDPLPADRQRSHLIVCPLQDFTPIGGGIDLKTYRAKAVDSTNWASNYIVPNPLSLSQQNGIPVLYVVDTGVQPLVTDASTPSKYNWHTELRAAAAAGKLRFRQGRVAAGLGCSWPKPGAAVPWNTAAGQVLNFTPTNLKPLAAQTSPYHVDPQKDEFGGVGHGTRIASTAIGAAVGVLGRFTVGGLPVAVDVESIRVYPSGNTITTTNSAAVSDGIYKAVNDHVNRGAGARSVLLFASRSVSGFAENVEIALWWAWYKGMIVVISGGNEPGAAGYADMHAPNCLWYTSAGVLPTTQPTTPSRFDSGLANTGSNSSYWPNPTAPGPTPIPYPNHVYLLIAGGNNMSYSGGVYTGTDGPRPGTGGASIGPDIDISAPSVLVPSMVPGSTINGIDGTSFSTGYVAGAALAYLAVKTTVEASTPDSFRTWLLPAGGPSGSPACETSGWAAWPGPGGHASHYINTAYGGLVPELKILTAPTP